MPKSIQNLLTHIDACPLGWHDEKIIRHRNTTETDILIWLQKLVELNNNIKQSNAVLDVRERKALTRTM